jgi:hypothetical protein
VNAKYTADEGASVTLTRDELHVLLCLLGVKGINGQPIENGASVSAEEESIRRNSGEFTLQARGLLTFEGERRVVLDEKLVALAGTAALPRATYLLQRTGPDVNHEAHFFSRGPHLLVEHTSPRIGLTEFCHIRDEETLRQRIERITGSLAECPHSAHDQTAEQVSAESMSIFLAEFGARKADAAVKALTAGGSSLRLAERLVTALKAYPHWLAIAGRADTDTQTVVSSTVMVIQGDADCWLIESDSDSDARVSIHPINGEQCRTKLLEMTKVLQQE